MLLKIFALTLTIIVFLVVLALKEIKRELNSFKTIYYEIDSAKLLNVDKKVVFLSDLHNHVYGDENDELLDVIRQENPDYIFIGGDMVVSSNKKSYIPGLSFVKKLTSICPVYYANGNHEQRLKEKPDEYVLSYAAYRRILKEAGIHFLENDSVILEIDGVQVRLTGLEIPLTCYKHFQGKKLFSEELTERIGESQKEYYEILLAHNPFYTKKYVEWGADLVLSGHLHGGIVRLPFIGGVIAPNFRVFPKYSGDIYEENDAHIVVSKGLGTHTVNIRLFNPAELVVLHLKGNSSCIKQENPV